MSEELREFRMESDVHGRAVYTVLNTNPKVRAKFVTKVQQAEMPFEMKLKARHKTVDEAVQAHLDTVAKLKRGKLK